jgi:hypothetical protein
MFAWRRSYSFIDVTIECVDEFVISRSHFVRMIISDLNFMFLALIAFIVSSFRHYIMLNHQHLVDDDNEDDDETSKHRF